MGMYEGGMYPKMRMSASSLLDATTDSVTVVQVGLWKWHTCHRKCLSLCIFRIVDLALFWGYFF
jgi:hypothetical protein